MPHETTKNAAGALDVAVLVSVGRHPVTGRTRRADQDARAVEAALTLNKAHVRLIHAGRHETDSETALRGYLGMGFEGLTLIEQTRDADVLPALTSTLREAPPRLLLCGTRAETGEGSGLLPYLLAESLGWPIVTGLAEIERIEPEHVTLLQALPRGQRRRLRVRLPAVITVDEAAPAPRQSAFGPARRGRLVVSEQVSRPDAALAGWTLEPARPRPKRLKVVKAASARDRFKAAAAKAEGGGGQVLTDATPEQGAEAIVKLLQDEGVLRRLL
ncbi:MAG: electron transfer flavoprotein beta subunit [Halomonadaceae bacterium T82-2]|nr:MAG: electron transfer flavoprotein beta subunit [Halomonadaceae bacterium T82-2]